MATISKRKGTRSTTYRVQVRKRGQYAAETFTKLEHAKRWISHTENAIEEGKFFATSKARKHTVSDLAGRYIRDKLLNAPVDKDDREKSKDRTYTDYLDGALWKRLSEKRGTQLRSADKRFQHLRWWVGEIGDLKLADLRTSVIVEKRDLLAQGETVRGIRSPATVNRYLASLSHALSIATKEWDWLESSPVRNVARKKEPMGRVRFLDDDEREQLLEAAKDRDDSRLYPLLVLSLATGLRQSEALRLKWKDIDFRRGVAVIHRSKNSERRAVPVMGFVANVLRDFKKVQPIDKDALVFADEPGSAEATFPRAAWARALKAAEIENFRWHDTRHCAASALAQSGASLLEIATVLGHKTLQMVKRYAHLTEQTTAAAVARANKEMFKGVS